MKIPALMGACLGAVVAVASCISVPEHYPCAKDSTCPLLETCAGGTCFHICPVEGKGDDCGSGEICTGNPSHGPQPLQFCSPSCTPGPGSCPPGLYCAGTHCAVCVPGSQSPECSSAVASGTDAAAPIATVDASSSGSVPPVGCSSTSQCRTNADCPAALPVCGAACTCVQCRTNADCGAAAPICSPAGSCTSGTSGGCVAQPPGMVGWWKGDGTPADSTGADNLTPFSSIGYVPGKVGQAFSFDGKSVLMGSGSGLPTGAAPRTVELWVEPTGPSGIPSILVTFGTAGATFAVVLSAASEVEVVQGNTVLKQGPALAPATWHYVAVIFDGSSLTLFVDGMVLGTTPPPISTSSGQLGLGGSSQFFGRGMTGLLDEVTIYGRALSIAEIQGIYAAGAAGKCAK